jgi:hypothetical protein
MWNPFKRKPSVDDTYYALRGYTYEQVEVELLKSFKKQNALLTFEIYILIPISIGIPDKWMADRNAVLAKHAWTQDKFCTEFLKRNKPL